MGGALANTLFSNRFRWYSALLPKFSSVLVPLMAVSYVLLALVIIVMNIQLIPHVFRLIVENAFGFEQVAGGGLGATMMNGIKRGLFSNEAGEGSCS